MKLRVNPALRVIRVLKAYGYIATVYAGIIQNREVRLIGVLRANARLALVRAGILHDRRPDEKTTSPSCTD